MLQYRLWVGDDSVSEIVQLQKKIEQQKKSIEVLEERNRLLNAEVLNLKSGLDAIEERARSELGMIKKGEQFYQIVKRPKKEGIDE